MIEATKVPSVSGRLRSGLERVKIAYRSKTKERASRNAPATSSFGRLSLACTLPRRRSRRGGSKRITGTMKTNCHRVLEVMNAPSGRDRALPRPKLDPINVIDFALISSGSRSCAVLMPRETAPSEIPCKTRPTINWVKVEAVSEMRLPKSPVIRTTL